jgi:hypothetical protein
MLGRVRGEPPPRLGQLTLAADSLAATGLVPGHGNVDEALKEVALSRFGRAPRVLELFVGLEVPALANQLQSALVAGRHPVKLAAFRRRDRHGGRGQAPSDSAEMSGKGAHGGNRLFPPCERARGEAAASAGEC